MPVLSFFPDVEEKENCAGKKKEPYAQEKRYLERIKQIAQRGENVHVTAKVLKNMLLCC
jgi:hypothetical protein